MHQTKLRRSKRIFVALMVATAAAAASTTASTTALANPSAAVFAPTSAAPQDDTPWP